MWIIIALMIVGGAFCLVKFLEAERKYNRIMSDLEAERFKINWNAAHPRKGDDRG